MATPLPTHLQASLFGDPATALPDGMVYQEGFLDAAEESHLLELLAALPLAAMRYGEFTAKREVLSFHSSYDFTRGQLEAAPALPLLLEPLRQRVADWAGLPAAALAHVLVARYRPGTPLGWHRDVPDFEDVVGVSLGGEALMRLRPYPPDTGRRSQVHKLVIAPRSIYLLRGAARWSWQHSVAPVKVLRYSITFRTARQAGAAPGRRLSRPAAGP